MKKALAFLPAAGATLLIVILLAVGCSGGSDSTAPHFNDPNGNPGMQGDVNNPPTGHPVSGSPVVGATAGAPLGTNPEYGTQEISELISTTRINDGASSLRSASENDRVLWVAVAKRGEEPIPGTDAPPIAEGDEIDLYIRYQVFEGELSVSRQWILEEAGLNYIEPSVSHAEAGTYEAVFPFTLAYGTGTEEAIFKGVIGPQRTSSVVVIPDMHDYREVLFQIIDTPTLAPVNYPPLNPDVENDSDSHGKGCLPDWITVGTFGGTTLTVASEKDLSNVVLLFDDGTVEKWDNLDVGESGVFYGTDANDGKIIVGAWVKSGCNQSGDGPGYGEAFGEAIVEEVAMAQFAWDDNSVSPDYDYNDFVGRLNIAETRLTDNSMVQLQLTAKALARGSDNVADWQFNVGASFPDATQVFVLVNQYYADGTPHGGQRIYVSAAGATIPVFSPTSEAFPSPAGTSTVNTQAGSNYYDGDYAEVLVILSDPQAQGTYSPIPYEPELLVSYGEDDSGNPLVETIPLWSEPGDPLNEYGYPQAYIVPDTFAWVLDAEGFAEVYPEYELWVDWINDQDQGEPTPPWWQFNPMTGTSYFKRDLFN